METIMVSGSNAGQVRFGRVVYCQAGSQLVRHNAELPKRNTDGSQTTVQRSTQGDHKQGTKSQCKRVVEIQKDKMKAEKQLTNMQKYKRVRETQSQKQGCLGKILNAGEA